MIQLQIFAFVFFLGLSSCTHKSIEVPVGTSYLPIDSMLEIKQNADTVFLDTLSRIIVDDYFVPNKMFAKLNVSKSDYKKQSGEIYSMDKVWFGNDTLDQTIVFELYADQFRLKTFHFYNKDIPTDLINMMELHTNRGELAAQEQKRKDFSGFLNTAIKINSSYFVSNKGFTLGDSKQKAIGMYGNPDKQSLIDGLKKLEWTFVGAIFYDGKTDLKGKPLAENSFGHQIIMYFKSDTLVGLVLHNDIP